MRIFGLKAFLRAIAVFGTVFLLKFAIEFIIQVKISAFLKIVYSIGAVVIISMVVFYILNMASNKLEKPDTKQGGSNNENKQ